MDAHWGTTLATWPAVGFGQPSMANDDRTTLVADPFAGTALLLDTGTRGENGDAPTCKGKVAARSLAVENDLAAFLETCDGGPTEFAQVVDLKDRNLLASLPGWGQQQLALSPDGTSFVSQEAMASISWDRWRSWMRGPVR